MARSTEKGSKPKSRPPSGYQRGGLCLADPLALALLQAPPGQPPLSSGGVSWNCYTVIVEGEPDYLTVSTFKDRIVEGGTYACLGWIGSGGLELELCQRIPENSRVIVAIQRDGAGGAAALATLERLASLEKGLELSTLELEELELGKGLEEGEAGKDLNDALLCLERKGLELSWVDVLKCSRPWIAPSPLVPAPPGQLQAQTGQPSRPALQASSSSIQFLTGPLLWPSSPPPPPVWALLQPASNVLEKGRGVIPFGKVGLFGAPGGSGKTWALSNLALSVITGRSWFSSNTRGERIGGWLDIGKRGRVLVVGGEDTLEDLQRRYYETSLSIGLEEEERLACLEGLVAVPGAGKALQLLSRDGLRTPFLEGLEERLEGEPFGLVILDPLARFSPADSETDSHIATRLIETLEGLTGKGSPPPLVIAAHHTRKGAAGADKTEVSSGDFRGSSALIDGARFGFMLERLALPSGDGGRAWKGLEELTGIARISIVKSNVGSIPPAFLVGRRGGGALTGLSELELESLERAKGASRPSGANSSSRSSRVVPPS
jgi:hypothetical protein